MATYITYYKLTDQGSRSIKESPARVRAATDVAAKAGGKIHAVYYTHGEWDLVTIADWPNDEAVTVFMLGIGAAGNVHTATHRAFSVDEMAAIVKQLP